MKKIKILFQGDSITDAGRDRRNYYNMGAGYPKYASESIVAAYPNTEFEFINLGISGNRTDQLFDRLYPDAIALEPDVISILVGVNDVWHRHGGARIMTADEQVERAIACGVKKVQFDREHVDAAAIEKAHAHGIRCNLFYTDDCEEARRFFEMGIDTILTNDYQSLKPSLEK